MECKHIFESLYKLVIVKIIASQILFVNGDASKSCTFQLNGNKPPSNSALWNAINGKRFGCSDNQYTYNVGICTSASADFSNEKDPPGATQVKKDGKTDPIKLGLYSNADYIEGGDWLMLQYFDGDKYRRINHCNKGNRSTIIMISCSKGETVGVLKLLEEVSEKIENCYYLFELLHDKACVSENSSSVSLSVGSILVIVFLSFAAAYLFFGFLYQRFIKGAQGREQFPNYSFWKQLGNLASDGCSLVFRSDTSSESREYRGLTGNNLPGNEDIERDTIERDDPMLNM